jgi:predicted cupin superfamily sugar epimerase
MTQPSSIVTDLIAKLGLEPHPEGGWFKRIYTAPTEIETANGRRPAATSIWYLLGDVHRSGRRHRNRSDILHFLIDGGPVIYRVGGDHDGASAQTHRLAVDGERYLLVPGKTWKYSELAAEASHALVAEVVTPGFDFADHEFAEIAGHGANTDAGDLGPA